MTSSQKNIISTLADESGKGFIKRTCKERRMLRTGVFASIALPLALLFVPSAAFADEAADDGGKGGESAAAVEDSPAA
ncbi:MAG: hypothetical protein IJI68_12990, partial [Eggerthellaceae bacterium]|nr:hypothetical protein [Eggerthellaceae bacterium]